MAAQIVKVHNVFRPLMHGNRTTISAPAGVSLAMYLRDDYAAVCDGKSLDASYIIKDNDNIVIVPIIRGGGGGGKQILSIIAIVALTIVAGPAGAAIGSSIAGGLGLGAGAALYLGYAATAAILIGGNMLVNSLFAPDVPTNDFQSIDSSPSFSWGTPKTVSTIGRPIPVLYGTMRLSGNVINSDIDYAANKEYLQLQLGLCHGPVRPIEQSDVTVNGTNLIQFKGDGNPTSKGLPWFEQRQGLEVQTPVSMFNTLESKADVNVLLSPNVAVVRQVLGSGFDAIEINLKAHRGIYQIDSRTGGIISKVVDVRLEYREVGTSEWLIQIEGGRVVGSTEYEVICDAGFGQPTTSWWFLPVPTYVWRSNSTASQATLNAACSYVAQGVFPNAYTRYTGRTRATVVARPTQAGPPGFGVWFWWSKDSEEALQLRTNSTNPVSATLRFGVDPKKDYEVRLTRKAAGFSGLSASDDVTWLSLNGLINRSLSYPTLANIAVDLLATDQISGGSPNFSVEVSRDLIDIYNEEGIFQSSVPSYIPAWAAWDLLTNETYGAGIPYSDIDLTSFTEWAQWSTTIVDNGRGELIPRAEFNGVIDFKTNAWEAVQKIGAAGRAQILIKGTKYSVVVDKPETAVQTFTTGNILKDTYTTIYSPLADIATEVVVEFINREKNYTKDTISVQLEDVQSVDQVSNKVTISAFGVTSEAQAYRYGRYMLVTSNYLRRTVNFEADIDSIAVTVGDVINFAHDVPQWGESGRIMTVNAATKDITLDRKVYMEDSKTYEIMIRYADDVTRTFNVPVPGMVTGNYEVLNVPTLLEIPSNYSVYSLGTTGNASKLFRVTSVTRTSEQQRRITAVEYNESLIDDDITILPTSTPFTATTTPVITDILVENRLEKREDGTIIPFTDLSWSTVSGNLTEVTIYQSSHEFINYTAVSTNNRVGSFTMSAADLVEGETYYFKFRSYNELGGSESLEDTPAIPYFYQGKLEPPEDVTNFTAVQLGQSVVYAWDPNPDADISHYEIRRGVTWESATVLVSAIRSTTYTRTAEFNGTFEYLIKAIDTSGVYSVLSTSVTATLTGVDVDANAVISGDLVVDNLGTEINLHKVNGKLLSKASLFDDLTGLSTQTDVDLVYSGDEPLLTEYISEVLDTQKIGTTTIKVSAEVDSFFTSLTDLIIPNRTDISFPKDTDVTVTSTIDTTLSVRVSDDDITYGPWVPYTAVYSDTFRYLQIKHDTTYDAEYTRVQIDSIQYSLDVPDITITIKDFAVSAAGENLLYSTYGEDFYIQSVIQTTVQDAGKSVTPDVTNKTLNGFTIKLYDAADVLTAGTVDITIIGY